MPLRFRAFRLYQMDYFRLMLPLDFGLFNLRDQNGFVSSASGVPRFSFYLSMFLFS